jgi:hypothetical protein
MLFEIFPDHLYLPGRKPEAGTWKPSGDLYDLLQVPEPLKISAVVPTKILIRTNKLHHRLYPQGMLDRLEATLKGSLDVG